MRVAKGVVTDAVIGFHADEIMLRAVRRLRDVKRALIANVSKTACDATGQIGDRDAGKTEQSECFGVKTTLDNAEFTVVAGTLEALDERGGVGLGVCRRHRCREMQRPVRLVNSISDLVGKFLDTVIDFLKRQLGVSHAERALVAKARIREIRRSGVVRMAKPNA